MINDLLLITGAGASKAIYKDFGSGIELLDQISVMLTDKNDTSGFQALFTEQTNIDTSYLGTFNNNLIAYKNNSTVKSIDEFLSEVESFPEFKNYRDNYLTIGKTAIIFKILEWEKKLKQTLDSKQVQIIDTWIGEIIKFIEENNLINGYDKDKRPFQKSLQILTFNYDRVLEYCLQMHFATDVHKTKRWISNNIIHVYGAIDLEFLEFGADNSNIDCLIKYKNDIQTSYERRSIEQNAVAITSTNGRIINGSIPDILVNKPFVFVMGFSFDYFNCKNIGLQSNKVVANIYEDDQPSDFFRKRRVTTNRVRAMFDNILFRYKSCKDFLNEIRTETFNF